MKSTRLAVQATLLCLLAVAALVFGGLWGGAAGIAAACALLAAAILVLSFILMRLGQRRPGRGTLENVGPHRRGRRQNVAFTRDYIEQKRLLLAPLCPEEVFITSHDGLRLHGLFVPGRPGEARCVVLCHGYGMRALQMAEYAHFWHETYGFNVLMPDARAHGESAGRYAGMGWLDRRDILQWFDHLTARLGTAARFVLHGISMGGATAMMVAGEQTPAGLKFVVEDCGYTDVKAEFSHQVATMFFLPPVPFIHVASLFSRLFAGYSYAEASALRQVRKASLPMLFIHGEADRFVPFSMVHPLFEQCTSADKRLITVPGAAHIEAFWKDESGRIRAAIARAVAQYLPDT